MNGRTEPAPTDVRLARLFAQGLTDPELGQALGLAAGTVRHHRHRLGLLRRPTPAEHVPDATLAHLAGEALTDREIARRTGLTYRTVQERMSQLGLTRRG